MDCVRIDATQNRGVRNSNYKAYILVTETSSPKDLLLYYYYYTIWMSLVTGFFFPVLLLNQR